MIKKIKIEDTWKNELGEYFATNDFKRLLDFIESEYASKEIYPETENIFKAFWLTPFYNVKVVILGQDPYHGKNLATGLSFSVPIGQRLPPSLKNIYKEIESDLGLKKDFSNGSLDGWAKQGVFMLNAVLTVVAGAPASHKEKGWEKFTDVVIKAISDKKENIVFILWGNFARSKKVLIDSSKHLIIESSHPSPFSAHSGFFGSKPFSKCNTYLKNFGKKEIDW